ncbi:MAG TPA: SgcJ/EcaC family oxidoreductase [Polyangiaceae bacterium]|nr:SgcJ/EcaC family oxidoreductase [Polyangiaceae bacterium]
MATTTDDIEKTAQEYAAAWSSGDAKAAAAFFTTDAVRVDAVGGVQHGRGEIQAALDQLVHRTLSVPKIALSHGTVRVLTPELAVWRGDMGIVTADGAPALKGYVVLLMRRDEGRWLVLEAHPKLYPPS